ncbi:hypothetical protein CF319_g2434 [Tilletia indica]|nr:hypothetical protein CF319_g2434 [Tilletia indica]
MPESPYSYPDPKQATTLYKVLTSAEAEALPSSTSTTAWLGSPLDISDGFLHTSTVHQLPITLRRFFTPENPDVGDTVHIYALPRERIAEGKLRWDHLKSGEVFGHVIGASTQAPTSASTVPTNATRKASSSSTPICPSR